MFAVKPYVHQFDKSKNVIQADPLTLVCSAWSVPEPTVTWLHNGEKIVPEESAGRIMLKNGTVVQHSTFPILENGTLRVDRMDYVDAGNYTCVVTNQYGQANATVVVQVKGTSLTLRIVQICREVKGYSVVVGNNVVGECSIRLIYCI